MKKVNYNQFVTEDNIENILLERYPKFKCPECSENGIYASGVESQYDEKSNGYVVLSFDVFCKKCGAVLGKWDNTNREYFLGQRRKW